MQTHVLDELVSKALGASYHTGDGGWDTTAVRWWVKYHIARGEDPFVVAMPDAPHEEKLQDEWRFMRFQAWLVESKEPGVAVDTAAQYGSTVQGFLARVRGVKLGGGMEMLRLREMLRGLHRSKGGKPARKLRRALTPQQLAAAFLKQLDPRNPLHANVRAALATMLQGLLRGGEAGVSDKAAGKWSPQSHITRADVTFTDEAMRLVIAPLKSEQYMGSKSCPVVIGRAEPGSAAYVDAAWEVLNMFSVDPVRHDQWGTTPMFRDPSTGRALRVSELNEWVQWLMASIGEPAQEYGSHSCRIGGATAMYAAGYSELDIRTMGRWDSDVYRIYVRGDRARAAACTRGIGAQAVAPSMDPYDEVEFF